MQKINLFHEFILEIQQILESKLKRSHLFLTTTIQKIIKVTFGLTQQWLKSSQKFFSNMKMKVVG